MESLPPIKKAIGCKWVYKIKYHSNGCIERFKPRPVIFGNNHFEGIGYHETFSPVVKMVTLSPLLSLPSLSLLSPPPTMTIMMTKVVAVDDSGGGGDHNHCGGYIDGHGNGNDNNNHGDGCNDGHDGGRCGGG